MLGLVPAVHVVLGDTVALSCDDCPILCPLHWREQLFQVPACFDGYLTSATLVAGSDVHSPTVLTSLMSPASVLPWEVLAAPSASFLVGLSAVLALQL